MFDMVTKPGFILGIVLGVGVPAWLSQSMSTPNTLVELDYATFKGASMGPLTSFLGIPYAAPPVGDLRFARPQPPNRLTGIQNATKYGPGCYQQALSMRGAGGAVKPFEAGGETSSEDCLSVNVIKPAHVGPNAKLPVVFSIHGGGYAVGTTSKMDFGLPLVARSLMLGAPVIYVSTNYRLNAFGFLASEEVNAEGNLNAGFYDQRMALEWTRKYISRFGGDPEKVIIHGQSAGAMSVGMQMLANEGNAEGLFRGAIMQSGAPLRLSHYPAGQPYVDQLAKLVDCDPSRVKSALVCLRTIPAERLYDAIQKTPDLMEYSSIRLSWQPRREVRGTPGALWTEEPWRAVEGGRIAKVPVIITANHDEGTMFALSSLNVTTNDQFKEYIEYLTGMNAQQAEEIARVYPEEPAHGSPYETGTDHALSPQYKRISAFLGDSTFHGPHRFFLEQLTKQGVPAWSYMFKAGKGDKLGAYHGADMGNLLFLRGGFDYMINFAYTLDPNTLPFVNPLKFLSSPMMLLFTLKTSSPSLSTLTGFFTSLAVQVPQLSSYFPNHTSLPYYWPPYAHNAQGKGTLLVFHDASDEDAHPASKVLFPMPAPKPEPKPKPKSGEDGEDDSANGESKPGSVEGGGGLEDLGLGGGRRLWKVTVEEDSDRREAIDVLVKVLRDVGAREGSLV